MKASDLPRNIRWFERIAYGWLALNFALEPFNDRFWPSISKHPVTVFVLSAMMIAITIFWIREIARGRGNILRWAWGVLSPLGLYTLWDVWQQGELDPVWVAQAVGGALEAVVTTWLLFTGDAVPWFRKEPAANPAIFD